MLAFSYRLLITLQWLKKIQTRNRDRWKSLETRRDCKGHNVSHKSLFWLSKRFVVYITTPAILYCFLAFFFSNPYSLFENFIFYHSSLCAFFLYPCSRNSLHHLKPQLQCNNIHNYNSYYSHSSLWYVTGFWKIIQMSHFLQLKYL